MIRLPNVATPPTAETVTVRLPEEKVPLPRVSVTLDVSVVTGLPKVSRTPTVTAGLIAQSCWTFVGCCTKTSMPPRQG